MFLDTNDLFDEKIKLVLNRTSDEDPKVNWSAAYIFDIALLDNTVIGTCDLRINDYDSLYYSGNIGYGIKDNYRGNGYAVRAVNLLVRLAKKHQMKNLKITCDPSNNASRRVIEKAKFRFIERTNIPKYHQMYKEGLREVLVYELNLQGGIFYENR